MTENKTHRYQAFDSLRSIAALVVLLAHAQTLLALNIPNLPWPLSGLLDSRAAVAFFFVLSGFVLHLSLSKTELSFASYVGFQVRRILRIYPLYYLSLLAVLAAIYLQDKNAFPLFHDRIKDVLAADHRNVYQWLQQLLLIGPGFDMYFLNPPAWTLVVEMRVAIFFPVISWIVSRLSIRKGAIFVCASVLAAFIGGKLMHSEFIELIPLFLMGAFFAQHRNVILNAKISPAKMWSLILLSFIFYTSRFSMRDFVSVCWYVLGFGSFSQTTLRDLLSIGWYACGLGSLGIMLLVVRNRMAAKFLLRPALVFLGALSYGIYVLHFPVFLWLSAYRAKFNLSGSAIIFFLLGLLLTIAISFLTYRFVEAPFIELGRKLSGKLGRKAKATYDHDLTLVAKE